MRLNRSTERESSPYGLLFGDNARGKGRDSVETDEGEEARRCQRAVERAGGSVVVYTASCRERTSVCTRAGRVPRRRQETKPRCPEPSQVARTTTAPTREQLDLPLLCVHTGPCIEALDAPPALRGVACSLASLTTASPPLPSDTPALACAAERGTVRRTNWPLRG